MNSPGCGQDARNTYTVYGKLAAIKITNVLYSNKYCCICLETCDGLLGFDTCGVVDGGEKNLMIMTLKEMLEAIFDETVLHILRDSSDHLCPACTESIKQTLSFIQQTKTHALIFARYFTTLNRLTTNLLQLSETETLSTVVLNVSLDNIPKNVQREGVKRKNEDAGPQVHKIAKVANRKERDKLVETTADIMREDSENGGEVRVIAEIDESRNDKASPGNSDKGSQQLSPTSEPMHVPKECCPVCEKRPCIHEKYLEAFEKRRRNGVIECPECKELLNTLNDLIKHVNMDHFKHKPTIRDVCNKIFQRDLVNTGEATKIQHPLESHEFENRDQFLHEVVIEEPPIGTEIIIQDEPEKDNEVMEQDEKFSQTHIEQLEVPSREKVSLTDLLNKRYKILRLERQESEDRVLNSAASSTKDTCSTGTVLQKETDKNIKGRETEQIVDKNERDLSDEQHKEQNAIEQKIEVHIDSEPIQCDVRNDLVQNNLGQNDKTLIPDLPSTSDVQKKVLTGILKKDNTARKKHTKTVKFADCPTLSDWRQATISANTELHVEAKINDEMKSTKKAKENENSSSTNIEQDISKIKEGIEILNSKCSIPLGKKGHVNKTAQRELSIVLIDVLKNRKLPYSQPQTSVFDDRYKILLTNIKNDKIRRLGSKQKQPVNSTENPGMNETTVRNKSDIHEGIGMNVGKALQTLQVDSPKTNQGTSLACREKPISGIFESTEVSHKMVITQNKRVLPEVSVCISDVLQSDNDLNQNPQIPNYNVVTDLSKGKIINPVAQKHVKCTQYKKQNVSPNKRDSINTQNVHEKTNIELKAVKVIYNDIQKEVFAADISKEKNVNSKPQESIKSTVTLKLDVSPKNPCIISQKQQEIVPEKSNTALKTVQFICNDIQRKGRVNILSNEIIAYPKPQESTKSTVIAPKNIVSPNEKDSINVPEVLHVQTNIDLKTSQEIVEKSKGQLTCRENRGKNTESNDEKVLNLEIKSPPSKIDSTNRQSIVREQPNIESKTAQEILKKTEGKSTCIGSRVKRIVRPNDEEGLNFEGKSSPNLKDSRNTHSVVKEHRNIELKSVILVHDKEQSICKENTEKNMVSPNDGKEFNLEIKKIALCKKDTMDTQNVVHEGKKNQLKTAKVIVGKYIGQTTSKGNREKKSALPNEAKVPNLGRTHARIIDRKKLRRELVKKTTVGNVRKKNGTMYRLLPVLRNPTKESLSLSDNVTKNIVEESDERSVEKEEPVSMVEIIEEAKIMEKNKKQLLSYEKQRRNRTFECPECKKMLYSLKDLIAHVNKNNCNKKTSEMNSKESLSDIQGLKSVVKIPTLGHKTATSAAPKRICTSIETDDARKTVILKNDSSIIHEPATPITAQKKSSQKENEVKCSQCNVLACKHERYRQAYDKLRKNKIIKCPDCKYIIYSLSDFIEHVNKNHTGNKIILRDIYYEEFPSTFVRTDEKSEKIKNDCEPAGSQSLVQKTVPADKVMGMNAKSSKDDASSEAETPMEFEVEFLEDMEELEEIEENETDREIDTVTNEDKTTGDKSNETVKCHKCQLICPNEETYNQHIQEHELLEVTAELELEDMMKNETENVAIEGNKRSYKCGTCGAICKSRMQLTLHLKSTGHVLRGTISCPQCAKRPCRHEKYLCAYEKQRATGKIECYECKNTHSSLSDLIAHVNNEHLSKFIKCDVCDKMVRSNLFKKHNSNCYKQQAPVKCAKCPALFVNEEAYMVHNLEHELLELKQVSMEAELTKKSKTTLKELESSEITDEQNTNKCGTCGKIFRHRSWLKLHLKTTDHVVKTELSCPQCSKRPCKHEDYLLAFENHNEKNKVKCQQCKDSINSLNDFIEHVNKDHLKNKPIKCDCCKEEFYLKSQLITHLKVHEPKLTCEHCCCEFRRSLFRKHKIKCQYVKKRVKCAKCPALFPNEKAYTIHKQEHPELLDNAAAASVKKSSFNRDTEEEGNSKKKSNKAKYDCPICRLHCSRREKLSTHLISVHKMESRRTCCVCVKVFVTRQQYLDHREAMKNKFNKCNIYNEKILNMRPNPSPREKRSCNVCKRMVPREAFAVHLSMHAREPYPCHGCSKRFKRSSDRALHVKKAHSGR